MQDIPMCSASGCSNPRQESKKGGFNLHCSRRCCAIDNAEKSAEKKQRTCIEKYGSPSPFGSATIIANRRIVLNEKYGVDNISQLEDIKKKKKETLLKNYGVDHPLKSTEIQNKVKATLVRRYGVDHVSYIGKTAEQISLLKDPIKIAELNKEFNLYSLADQYGFSDRTLREILENNNIEPIHHLRSSFEKEVCAYIKTIFSGVITEQAKFGRKEIDIFLNELNLGFECNGAYWHSEIAGKRGKDYHISKVRHFENLGIRIFQIWDYQWYTQKDTIKSMISHILGRSTRIYARCTTLVKLTKSEEMEFFNSNHLQGHVHSNLAYGLVVDGVIMSAMNFRKSRYDKSVDWELLRFCNKKFTTVVAGASRMFVNFLRNHHNESIISYSHKHISNGNLYNQLGFSKIRSTSPSYSYTLNYKTFFSRMSYQKHKLQKLLLDFSPEITEWENMKKNGYDRIWDCGNDVWIYKQERK